MKLKITSSFLLIFSTLIFITSASFDPNNPPTRRTGAPGEMTCEASNCHKGGAFTSAVEITGLPDTVLANQTYPITLTNTSNAVCSGFEMTVLNEANAKVGTLTNGTGTNISNANNGRQYIRQASPKNVANGKVSWTFNWKAPATPPVGDSIHFYFVSLCANGNGKEDGDKVAVNTKTVVLPAVLSAAGNVQTDLVAKVFPNPAVNFIQVELPAKGKLQLMDLAGKKVLEMEVANSGKADVSRLPSGLYLAKLECRGQVKTQFIVKN